MKSLFRIVIASLLLLSVSAPAWAAVDISGAIFFDSYFYHQDKEGFARTGYTALKTTPGSGGLGGIPFGSTAAADDRNQTYFDLNHASHLRFLWTNQEGLGAMTVIYMNGDPVQQTAGDAGFKVGTSVVVLYYDVNKNLRLTVGKGGFTEVFSPFNPTTYMGYDGVAKVEGLGYGNINSKYENNIRVTYKVTPWMALDFALVDPRMVADSEVGFSANAGTAVDNVTKIPKMEFGIPMTFVKGSVKAAVTPSFYWMKSEFSNVAPGGEDTVDSYGASLGGSVSVGKLKLAGEINYGQNLWDAARSGISTCYPFKFELITGGLRSIMGAKFSTIDKKVHDSKTVAGWAQLGYQIGRVTPTLFYGRNESYRDMPTGPVGTSQGDAAFQTQMYGINAPIEITKNFKVVPEYMVYDNGHSNKLVASTDTAPKYYDFGKEWLAGVEFILAF